MQEPNKVTLPLSQNNSVKKPTLQDFQSPVMPTWCPGCGDYAIWSCLKQALVQQNLGPMDVLLCFDIGCNGNMVDKINAYCLKGLHGRVIPLAAGAHLANKNLPIIAIAGDGGTFDEGIQHFIHALRSNYRITFILHNNCDFGLTTGQATPTTPEGQKMNSSPYGVMETRLNPLQLALSAGATFIARGFTGNMSQLTELIKSGMQHNGFSYIDVLQHCPTYNDFQDLKWTKDRVYNVQEDGSYPNTRENAYKITDYSNEKIPTGILYQDKASVSFLDKLTYRQNYQGILKDEVKKYDITDSLKEFS